MSWWDKQPTREEQEKALADLQGQLDMEEKGMLPPVSDKSRWLRSNLDAIESLQQRLGYSDEWGGQA
jgi:hypothetical protein